METWGKVSGRCSQRSRHPSIVRSGVTGRAGLAAGSSAAAPGLPSYAFTSKRQCRASADFPARGNARCPKRPTAPPGEVAANEERGRAPSASAPRSSARRPLWSGPGSRAPGAVPAPAGHPRSPRHRERARRLAFSSAAERWGQGTRTVWLAGGGEGEGRDGKRRV